MVQSNDVSQNLDIVAQVPGDMLGRAVDGWARIPAASLGWALHAQGPGLVPIFVAGQPGVRLEKTISQNALNAVTTAIIWNAATFDDAGFWSAGEPTRITVPNGVSRMTFTAGWFSNTSNASDTLIFIRDQAGVGWANQHGATASVVRQAVTTGPVPVTPGDWFDAAVFPASTRLIGAGLNTFFAAEVVRAA